MKTSDKNIFTSFFYALNVQYYWWCHIIEYDLWKW